MHGLRSIKYHMGNTMNRRAFFSFLPAAPIGALMAAEAMAKAPPASMAPDKALMTLTAHKPPPPPPPPPKYPQWGSFTVYDQGDGEWYKNLADKHKAEGNFVSKESLNQGYVTIGDWPTKNKLSIGKGMSIEADMNFDEQTKVAMSVGKDGHLWLKINDEWKRIVTE